MFVRRSKYEAAVAEASHQVDTAALLDRLVTKYRDDWEKEHVLAQERRDLLVKIRALHSDRLTGVCPTCVGNGVRQCETLMLLNAELDDPEGRI